MNNVRLCYGIRLEESGLPDEFPEQIGSDRFVLVRANSKNGPVSILTVDHFLGKTFDCISADDMYGYATDALIGYADTFLDVKSLLDIHGIRYNHPAWYMVWND